MNGNFNNDGWNNQNNQNDQNYNNNLTETGVQFGANAFNKEAEPSFWTTDPGLNTGVTPDDIHAGWTTEAQKPKKEKKPINGLALAAMILGIVSASMTVMCCGWLGWVAAIITGIVGVILGIVALKKKGKSKRAVAGIVTGSVGIFLAIVFMVLMGMLFKTVVQEVVQFFNDLFNGNFGDYNDYNDSFIISSILNIFRK